MVEGRAALEPEYARTGVAVVRSLVDPELCRAVRRSLAPAFDSHPGADRLMDRWRIEPPVRDLARHPGVMDLLAGLYGRRPIPFQTLDFRHGTEQRLHADSVHFDSLPTGLMCGVWVALEDVEEHQGPLTYLPGSHLRPRVDLADARGPDGRFDYARYEELEARRVEGMASKRFLARTGDALVWAADLVHGGAPRRDVTSTRWSQVTHYFFQGATYVTPMLGDPVAGTHHLREPLVDIATGLTVVHQVGGGPARIVRLRGGRSHVLGPDDPPPGALLRTASAVRGVVRRARRRVRARGSW